MRGSAGGMSKRKADSELESSELGGAPEEVSAKLTALPSSVALNGVRPDAKARSATLSLAFPGSILQNCQTRELQAYVLGQIARTAAIFRVDEVIVFSEQVKKPQQSSEVPNAEQDQERQQSKRFDAELFAIRQLQYLETPQYLRKLLFPLDPDLRFAGLQNPLDAPHHVRAQEKSAFREGVVVPRVLDSEQKGEKNHLAECGLNSYVEIQQNLPVRTRITVRMIETPEESNGARSHAKRRKQQGKKKLMGEVVSRRTPVEELGVYWGYRTRLCKNGLSQVLSECPWENDGGYDVVVGTSDRGVSIYSPEFSKAVEERTQPAKHVLIVFGGLRGIESCILGDPGLVDISYAEELFDHYINCCPNQGSRTIRTEEAVMITLAALQPLLNKLG
jgi:predicted SPOUT superfamily RNA methylase MTH1